MKKMRFGLTGAEEPTDQLDEPKSLVKLLELSADVRGFHIPQLRDFLCRTSSHSFSPVFCLFFRLLFFLF